MDGMRERTPAFKYRSNVTRDFIWQKPELYVRKTGIGGKR